MVVYDFGRRSQFARDAERFSICPGGKSKTMRGNLQVACPDRQRSEQEML